MSSCFGDLVFHRVRYFSRKLYQGDGTFAQISLAGSLPTGHLYGLNSSATETGGLEQDLGLHHQLILEMLAGVRCPTGGAVLIPPYMTVGSVALKSQCSSPACHCSTTCAMDVGIMCRRH